MKTSMACGVLATLALWGCTSADPIKLPNGKPGFVIACDGGANRWSSCYKRAAELCPAGYDLVTQNGESRPMLVTTGPGMYTAGTIEERELMIECKTPSNQ
jgi:hypothetical protein